MFYLKEIYERLINVLNNSKSNYCSRINSLECFKLIAKKLKDIDDEIIGYHLTEIIFTLQNACKDRVHKVQLAANSAIKDWRHIEEIFERNKKKGKYDKQKNLYDKETNLFNMQIENNPKGNNYCKEDFENDIKYKEINNNYKKGKMNKLNVLRNLSKLNKQESNNSNGINTEEDDFFNRRKNNRNINEFFKFDEIKEKNKNKKSDIFKEETFKKGIGNVLKLSNLLRNFQKENNYNNSNNNFRSKSNPRMNKASPSKNKLLESVANYLKISRSGEKNNDNNQKQNYDLELNKEKRYGKGFITDESFYKKDKSPEFIRQSNLSEEELLDYRFLSDGEFYDKNYNENFGFENEAEKNIQNYEDSKKKCKDSEDNQAMKIGYKSSNNKIGEIRDKIYNENKDNSTVKKDDKFKGSLLIMKTDINKAFSDFFNKLEVFNNKINSKLNVIESKIKKNRKIIKNMVKEKKLDKHLLNKEEKIKESLNKSKGDKLEKTKNEYNKNIVAENNSKILENKSKEDSKIISKESFTESDNNKLMNKSKKSDKLNFNDLNKISESNDIYLKLTEQTELIINLKKEIEFYKKNSQDIFKNINYKVVDKTNSKEHSSITFWKEILYLVDKKDYNSAYLKVLENQDDLYLLRLLCITGPVLNFLRLDLCKKLIMRTNMIYRSHQIEYILLELINNSHQHYIFNLLTKNEQNEILETIFQFTNIKTIIGNIAADLYENITTNIENN